MMGAQALAAWIVVMTIFMLPAGLNTLLLLLSTPVIVGAIASSRVKGGGGYRSLLPTATPGKQRK